MEGVCGQERVRCAALTACDGRRPAAGAFGFARSPRAKRTRSFGARDAWSSYAARETRRSLVTSVAQISASRCSARASARGTLGDGSRALRPARSRKTPGPKRS